MDTTDMMNELQQLSNPETSEAQNTFTASLTPVNKLVKNKDDKRQELLAGLASYCATKDTTENLLQEDFNVGKDDSVLVNITVLLTDDDVSSVMKIKSKSLKQPIYIGADGLEVSKEDYSSFGKRKYEKKS